MLEFLAKYRDYQVLGQSMLAVHNLGGEEFGEILDILRELDLEDIQPGEWYPMDRAVRVQYEIENRLGPEVLRRIGRRVTHYAQFPPRIDSLDKALAGLDMTYQLNHGRDGRSIAERNIPGEADNVGHYHVNIISENSIEMICENPYSVHFNRGLLEGLLWRFLPEENKYIQLIAGPIGEEGLREESLPVRPGEYHRFFIRWSREFLNSKTPAG